MELFVSFVSGPHHDFACHVSSHTIPLTSEITNLNKFIDYFGKYILKIVFFKLKIYKKKYLYIF